METPFSDRALAGSKKKERLDWDGIEPIPSPYKKLPDVPLSEVQVAYIPKLLRSPSDVIQFQRIINGIWQTFTKGRGVSDAAEVHRVTVVRGLEYLERALKDMGLHGVMANFEKLAEEEKAEFRRPLRK